MLLDMEPPFVHTTSVHIASATHFGPRCLDGGVGAGLQDAQ